MADVTFSLLGTEELLAKIKSVKNDVRFKGGRFALRKAANVVAEALKRNAELLDDPATGRSISSNVKVRFSRRAFRAKGNLMFRVGIAQGAKLADGGDKGSGAPTPHWRLLEFGTEKMGARPFARPALENNIGQATAEFIKQYNKAIDRAIKRAKR